MTSNRSLSNVTHNNIELWYHSTLMLGFNTICRAECFNVWIYAFSLPQHEAAPCSSASAVRWLRQGVPQIPGKRFQSRFAIGLLVVRAGRKVSLEVSTARGTSQRIPAQHRKEGCCYSMESGAGERVRAVCSARQGLQMAMLDRKSVV